MFNDNVSVNVAILPNKPLSNFELKTATKKLAMPNFHGVYLRNTLPRKHKNKKLS